MTLSRDKTIQWVGNVFLESAGESGVTQSNFLAQWHDVLPENWRKHASIDLLKVCFAILYSIGLTKAQARFSHAGPSKERIVSSADIHKSTSRETPPSANTGGKASRKWHDKFRAGRK